MRLGFMISIFLLFSGWLQPAFARDRRPLTCQTVEVNMNHFAVIGPEDARQIGTYGLGPCIGVFLFDPKTKITAVAHVSANTDVNSSIPLMLREMQAKARAGGNTLGSPLQTRLIGGWELWSNQTLRDVEAALKAAKNPKLDSPVEKVVLAWTRVAPGTGGFMTTPPPPLPSNCACERPIGGDQSIIFDLNLETTFDMEPDSISSKGTCSGTPGNLPEFSRPLPMKNRR